MRSHTKHIHKCLCLKKKTWTKLEKSGWFVHFNCWWTMSMFVLRLTRAYNFVVCSSLCSWHIKNHTRGVKNDSFSYAKLYNLLQVWLFWVRTIIRKGLCFNNNNTNCLFMLRRAYINLIGEHFFVNCSQVSRTHIQISRLCTSVSKKVLVLSKKI